jgi:hypothetical protein
LFEQEAMSDTMKTLLAAVLSGVLSALCVMYLAPRRIAAPAATVVRAARFELVDAAGTVKAVLGTNDDHQAVLSFVDTNGKPQVELGLFSSDGGQILRFSDKYGRSRMTIASLPSSGTSLTMGDNSRQRLVLGFQPNDAPAPSDDDWGLTFLRNGNLSSWAVIGITKDVHTGQTHGILSLVQPDGSTWQPEPHAAYGALSGNR